MLVVISVFCKCNIYTYKTKLFLHFFKENEENHFSYYLHFSGINLSASELIQYRKPVGAGPSLKTCPK